MEKPAGLTVTLSDSRRVGSLGSGLCNETDRGRDREMASGQAMVCTGTGEGTPPPPLPLVMQPLQTPAPGPGEVLLRVDVAGLCHSDLHILDMMFLREAAAKKAGRAMQPLALSHEIGGTVVGLGEGVDSVTVGKQVCV